MIFYISQINVLIQNIKDNKVKALLICSLDIGYINEICNVIATKLNLNIRSLYNTHNLGIELNLPNLFDEKQVIKIHSIQDKQRQLKTLLNENFIHFPIFISDESSINSDIRKIFNDSIDLAIINCNLLDTQNILNIINKTTRKREKTIDSEAIEYLEQNLPRDYGVIVSELDKLMLLDKQNINLDDVIRVVSFGSTKIYIETLCIYFFSRDLSNLEKYLMNSQYNLLIVIRSLMQYASNIYYAINLVNTGVSIDKACVYLFSKTFINNKEKFKQLALQSNINNISLILSLLREYEVKYLDGGNSSLDKILMLIEQCN
ncbi:MAG: hypothetical protein AB8B67_03440 [Rickettsiaceae bacterium]